MPDYSATAISDAIVANAISALDPELRGSLIYALGLFLEFEVGTIVVNEQPDPIDVARVQRFFEVLSGQRDPFEALRHSRRVT